MQIEGTLCKWNDDRGFGFIAPSQGGPEVFVHISAFPRDGQRPKLGERLSFEIEIQNDGKKRAKSISRPVRIDKGRVSKRETKHRRERPSLFGRVILLVVLIALGTYVYREYLRRVSTDVEPIATEAKQSASKDTITGFRCDDRTYCSQMTSCAEATFFLRNCPGVKMDGNGDGVPCEQQWCTGK